MTSPALTVFLAYSKETKNTYQYLEEPQDDFTPPILRSLYLSKTACKEWGRRPDRLVVQIFPGEGKEGEGE